MQLHQEDRELLGYLGPVVFGVIAGILVALVVLAVAPTPQEPRQLSDPIINRR